MHVPYETAPKPPVVDLPLTTSTTNVLERIANSLERIANVIDKVEIKTKRKTIKRKPRNKNLTLLNENNV